MKRIACYHSTWESRSVYRQAQARQSRHCTQKDACVVGRGASLAMWVTAFAGNTAHMVSPAINCSLVSKRLCFSRVFGRAAQQFSWTRSCCGFLVVGFVIRFGLAPSYRPVEWPGRLVRLDGPQRNSPRRLFLSLQPWNEAVP